MRFGIQHWLLAGIASLAVHFGAVSFAVQPPLETRVAGGQEIAAATLGDAFSSTLVAGTTSDTVTPVQEVNEIIEPEPVQAVEPVEPEPVRTPSETESRKPVVADLAVPVQTPGENVASVESQSWAMDSQTPVREDAVSPSQTRPARTPSQIQSTVSETVSSRVSALLSVTPSESIKPEQAEETIPAEDVVQSDVRIPVSKPVRAKRRVAKAPAKKTEKSTRSKTPKRSKKKKVEKKKVSRPTRGAGGKAQQTAQQGGASANRKAQRAGNAKVSNYPGRVRRKLKRSMRYPRAAERKRIKGTVVIRFTLNSSGTATNVSVRRSSGFPELDQAALAAVSRASPFPKIPAEASRQAWTMSVPLAFN